MVIFREASYRTDGWPFGHDCLTFSHKSVELAPTGTDHSSTSAVSGTQSCGEYDGLRPEDILTPKGMESLAAYQALKGCNSVLFQLPAGPNTIRPGWQDNVTVQNHLNHAASGRKKISVPLLAIHGNDDPGMDLGTTTNAVHETATMFQQQRSNIAIFSTLHMLRQCTLANLCGWTGLQPDLLMKLQKMDTVASLTEWYDQLQRSKGRPISTSRLRPNAGKFCSRI